jgi:hypothetical protein
LLPLVELSKARVCGLSFAGVEGSNPARGMDVSLSVVSVVCFQVEVSSTGQSIVQRSPTDCGMSLSVIQKLQERGGPGPRWALEPRKITMNMHGLMQDNSIYVIQAEEGFDVTGLACQVCMQGLIAIIERCKHQIANYRG